MAKDPFEQFAMPNEIRAFVEQSVAQARNAFDGFIQAANKAVGQFQGHAEAARSGANEIAHKSMAYAEQNMASTFDFAQKLMQRQGPGRGHARCNPSFSAAKCRRCPPRFRSSDKVLPKSWWILRRPKTLIAADSTGLV